MAHRRSRSATAALMVFAVASGSWLGSTAFQVAAATQTPTTSSVNTTTGDAKRGVNVESPQPGEYRIGNISRSRTIITVDRDTYPNRKSLNRSLRTQSGAWGFYARATQRIAPATYLVKVRTHTPHTHNELSVLAAEHLNTHTGVVDTEPVIWVTRK